VIVEPASELTRELEERLRFETLLADLSLRFVNTPANDVDQEIQAAQRNWIRPSRRLPAKPIL
jgi:hypothetical protein